MLAVVMNRHAYLPKLFLQQTVKMVVSTTGNKGSCHECGRQFVEHCKED